MALTRSQIWTGYALGACAAGLGVLAAWQYAASREALAVERNAYIQREIEKLKLEVAEITGLRQAKTLYDTYVQTADNVRERSVVPAAEALAELSRLPQGVVLRSVSAGPNRLMAVGDAASEAEFARILPALEQSRFIVKAKLKETAQSAGMRSFRLEAEVSRPLAPASPNTEKR
jgi:Tfp pilus assembly protein PilN